MASGMSVAILADVWFVLVAAASKCLKALADQFVAGLGGDRLSIPGEKRCWYFDYPPAVDNEDLGMGRGSGLTLTVEETAVAKFSRTQQAGTAKQG